MGKTQEEVMRRVSQGRELAYTAYRDRGQDGVFDESVLITAEVESLVFGEGRQCGESLNAESK